MLFWNCSIHDPKVVFDPKMRKQQVHLAELLLAQDRTVTFGGQGPDFAFISVLLCRYCPFIFV
jgi:hypothetical protein